MDNYQDDKCSWGYITLCLKCAKFVANKRNYKYIHLEKKIEGFPPAETCSKAFLSQFLNPILLELS
ncbi:unnamed protein product, partial [marine sediment metagenome]